MQLVVELSELEAVAGLLRDDPKLAAERMIGVIGGSPSLVDVMGERGEATRTRSYTSSSDWMAEVYDTLLVQPEGWYTTRHLINLLGRDSAQVLKALKRLSSEGRIEQRVVQRGSMAYEWRVLR